MGALGKATNAGRIQAATVYAKNGSQRGVDSWYVGLYEDAAEPTIAALLTSDITEVSAPGYGRILLLDADWSVDSLGVATNLQKTFTASADWPNKVYGYFITDTASGLGSLEYVHTPLVAVSGVLVFDTKTIKVTPTINFASLV